VVLEVAGTSLGKDYELALADGRDLDPTPASLNSESHHVLLYTSGTTGRPKGVINVHRNMLAQTLDTTISTEARHEDVMLATTPFFTTGGMMRALTWLYLGQTIVIHERFDPDTLIDAIERHRVTMTTFIPTMLIRTLKYLDENPGHDLSSFRRVSYGGAPMGRELIEQALQVLGCDMQQRYGQTEAGGQVTILTPQDHRALLAGNDSLATSCGRETPQSEIRVVDQDGHELPSGEIGEFLIKADSMAVGYWNQPEKSADTFRPEGIRSGDMGWRDHTGYLHITGRKTDMIISGGFNVYPAEVERVISSHTGVEQVAVIGTPHPEWGERVVAVIIARNGIPTTELETQLRDLCRQQLGGYKQPRAFEFRTEMPLGPAGKVLKRELRESLSPSVS
jgi:acyl-CoA synthetase (AMP-forming)/AMP-acid ligase II